MPANEEIDRHDVIRQIGNTLVELDVLRSSFGRDTEVRKKLDGIRDDLDVAQRKLVRASIDHRTDEFQRRSKSLKKANQGLLEDIQNVEKIAETLEGLVKLVGAVQKIIGLSI